MSEPYEYYRFRWWELADLWAISREMSKKFGIEWVFMPDYNREKRGASERLKTRFEALKAYLFPPVQKLWTSDWLKVRADTLTAYLFPLKAMLFQKEYAPFTERDMELRERILELYPKNRSSFISIGFVKEPEIPT